MNCRGAEFVSALLLFLTVTVSGAFGAAADVTPEDRQAALEKDVTQGALRIVKDDATVVECPLQHTDVRADVAGFIARVKVTQTFVNPTDEKIEAVYVFPLPHEAAVDDMTMVIGDRRIVGLIKRRAEARRIYEDALHAGQTAALLEQERPNIFTQSVGNIEPGQEILIEISYIDVLRYDVGSYEFHFPMVVGPRYNPGAPISSPQPRSPELQGKVSPPAVDTTRVPDASRISPPVLKPGFRTGHDISLSLTLDAGVPVQDLQVTNHEATIQLDGDRRATVTLDSADSLPNKDFALRYDVTGKKPEMAVLSHTGKHSADSSRLGEGYLMLMIQPKEDERLTKSPPREIVFLVDVSGSMSGQPTAKVIDAMQHMLKLCRPIDTVQVVTFASQSHKLFETPVPVTEENISRALNFTQGLRGGGGTRMLEGVKMAIDQPLDKERLRIVVMLTDGYIGNEAEIVEHVGRNCGDRIRFWAIGIGSSPNMFLVDGVAKQGGGMGKKLGLNDDTAALTQEVMTRIQRAQLANLAIDWGDHEVIETYPARLPELWAGRPVIVFGRYSGSGRGPITVSGDVEGEPASWPLMVDLPAERPDHDALAKVWARKKIESLMHSAYYGNSPAVEEEVTALALDYRLMSQYTSFVAVDEKDAEALEPTARPPRRMLVPIPLPEGTQWEGFFGQDMEGLTFDGLVLKGASATALRSSLQPLSRSSARRSRVVNRLSLAAPSPARPRPAASRPAPRGLTRGPGGQALAGKRKGLFGGGGYGYALGGPAKTRSYYSRGLGRQLGQGSLGTAASGEEMAESIAGFAYAAWQEDGGKLLKAAQEALTKGQSLQKSGQLTEARTSLARAYFLASSAAATNYAAGQVGDQVLQALETLHSKQVAKWAESEPALKARLDIFLRDQSVEEALDKVAGAAGVEIRLLQGSLDDVTELLGGCQPRVTYLDLRGAQVSQALDWILQPARLAWRLDGGTIVAASDRRQQAVSAWIYDVSAVALPSAESLEEIDDQQKRVGVVKQASDEFLAAVRRYVKGGSEQSILWLAPGQLLVFGDPQTHASAARLLDGLVDPEAELDEGLYELHKKTVQRAAEWKESIEKRVAAKRLRQVADQHAQFGWQLLAAAADGRLDLEALTELQIAWNSDETTRLLDGKGAAIALRSLWIASESARALPDAEELQALATLATERSRAAARRMKQSLQEKPSDAEVVMAVMYAALAEHEDADLRREAMTLLAKSEAAQTEIPAIGAVARSLLGQPSDEDRQALAELINDGVSGDDLVALTALAARRAGGDVWQAFRSQLHDTLGRQPLAGAVVVLVNRLAQPALPMVALR